MSDISARPEDASLDASRYAGLWKSAAIVAAALLCGIVARDGWPDSVIAIPPLAALVIILAEHRDMPWNLRSIVCGLLATGSLFAVGFDPGPLNGTTAWIAIGAVALSRAGFAFDSLPHTANILFSRLLLTPFEFVNARSAGQEEAPGGQSSWRVFRFLALPIAALICFTWLLSVANPVIEQLAWQLSLAGLLDLLWSWVPAIALLSALLLWALVRMTPQIPARPLAFDSAAPRWHDAYFAPGAVILTLTLLNGLFLIQNVLDAEIIWSGAVLPDGMTYAAYAQRGAETLIVTVLLAAILMIIALWPGSRTEGARSVRLLVYLWIAQNIVLLASCVARTFFYIDAYGMSEIRYASLVWMALIAAGFILIAMRIMSQRSNLWLINRNLLAAFCVLWLSGFIDHRSLIAEYNVSRALDGAVLDNAYLEALGPSSLPALERYTAARFRDYGALPFPEELRAAWASEQRLKLELARMQNDWRHWTLRQHLLQTQNL